jgi:hypothetical protein
MPATLKPETRRAGRFILWVDGVGGFLVCTGERVTVGGPGTGPDGADFSFQASLSRRHATFIAEDERWWLEPRGATEIGGRMTAPATDRSLLPSSAELRLGELVRLRFNVPNPLSLSAVLTPTSGHRAALCVDGCVLMRQNMILAPGEGAHVRCPDWPGKLVLFDSPGGLACQPFGQSHAIAGRPARFGEPIRPGDVIQGDGFRFHIEPVPL